MYEDALKIIDILKNNGYESYIIGGYPRDKYLNINSNDIDICTNALPENIELLFDNVNTKNSKYGNTIVNGFEITTFRKENDYIDFRRPNKIEFVKTLKEDLNRRDFIINTLCIDENGDYIDLLGAIKDIDEQIIRTVGNTEIKLKQDVLRILRAIRFSTTLDFKLDIDIIDFIKKYGYLVKELSYTRKKEELNKIFNSNNKEKGIKLILEFGLDKYLEIDKLKNIDLNKNIWKQLDAFDIYPFTKEEIRQLKMEDN